jgi:SprT protein
MERKLPDQLTGILPAGSHALVAGWLDVPGLGLTFSRRRSHRMGAYIVDRQRGERILLNLMQHPYSLLITIAHEVAHMHVSRKYGRRVRPHGVEWQQAVKVLIQEAASLPGLPGDVIEVMKLIAAKPRSTHFSDPTISTLLMKYEDPSGFQTLLKDLPTGSSFSLQNGRVYVKGEKNRTRYRCKLAGTSRVFLITGAAPVHHVA